MWTVDLGSVFFTFLETKLWTFYYDLLESDTAAALGDREFYTKISLLATDAETPWRSLRSPITSSCRLKAAEVFSPYSNHFVGPKKLTFWE